MNKKAILLSAISLPVSYLISIILYWFTYLLSAATHSIIPILTMDISIPACVVTFNVIALICAFGKK